MTTLTRSRAITATLLALGIFGAAGAAQAHTDVMFALGVQPAGVYVQSAPAYVAPQPVYVAPRAYVAEPVYVRAYDSRWEAERRAEWRHRYWEHRRAEWAD